MLVQKLAQVGASRIAATLIFAISLCSADVIFADNHTESLDAIALHLKYGEFSKAIELADELPGDLADEQFAEIAAAQSRSGAVDAATRSVSRISNDKLRYRVLFQRGIVPGAFNGGPAANNQNNGNVNGGTNVNGGGLAGGVTEADFQPLINLIKSTIDPDTWDDANGDGTIQAYPAGVYVDSHGTLQKLKIDSKRNLKKLAMLSANDAGNRFASLDSTLRKISLNRLEKQAQILASLGQPVSEEIRNLAGIYEIKYLMYLPETRDVVIAGAAGPWETDIDGHAINIKTGKPVIQLDDLVVCLRNSQVAPFGNNGKFGCSITPRQQNLADTRQFVSTSTLKGKAWRTELQKTLGLQDIEVFGIDSATHAGRVLVEADYRMKLVAMGLEQSIPEIPSYMARLNVGPDGEVEPMDVVRWWFTMNYDEVVADENHHVFAFNGTGVKVLSENEFIKDTGERIHTGQSDGPTAGFAGDFTRHFGKIADKYPVYHRLKNLFDLAIVSALIRNQRLAEQADWNLTYFGTNPEYADHVYQVGTESVPHQVESVMNHRVITRRKKTSTFKHTLVGVSGGITFDSMQVLRSKSRVATDDSRFAEAAADAKHNESSNWWWD